MTCEDDARSSPIKFFFPIVTSQPANAVGVIGGQAVFSVVFSSTNPAIVTFQWQIQTDGLTWGDLVETTGSYEGVTTQTLTVKSIDNFLASLTSRNFRCRALYANAVPSYSNVASLSIPIHTDWSPGVAALYWNRVDHNFLPTIPAPVVTGMAGPLTYHWDLVPGGTIASICLAPTNAVGSIFLLINPPLGISYSLWQCTITNGTDTVRTDNLFVFFIGVAAPSNGGDAPQAAPLISVDGAAINTITGFVAPWARALQIEYRGNPRPAVTIDSPNAQATTFSLNSSRTPGVAVALVAWCGNTAAGLNSAAMATTAWLP